MAQIKPENLIGRQVYFKMSKKVWAERGNSYLTPYKLYTIVEAKSHDFYYILDDVGQRIVIYNNKEQGNKPMHLCELTYIILKRRAK